MLFSTDNLYLVFLHPKECINNDEINQGDKYILEQFISKAKKITQISYYFKFYKWYMNTLDIIMKSANFTNNANSTILINSKREKINYNFWYTSEDKNIFNLSFNQLIDRKYPDNEFFISYGKLLFSPL